MSDKEFKTLESINLEVINNKYSKYKNEYYYGESADLKTSKILEGLDSITYEIINDFYAKDKNFVYKNIPSVDDIYKKIDGSDGKTFEIINDHYAKDNNYLYYLKKFKEEFIFEKTDKWIDFKTFEIIDYDYPNYANDKNFVYAKDKNFVYHMGGERWFFIYKIEGADPETFEVIKWGFTKDKNFVYSEGRKFDCFCIEKIKGADPKTFIIIDQYKVKDKSFVYTLKYYDYRLDGSSPQSRKFERNYIASIFG